MPATSKKQRRLFAIALKDPDKLYKKNKGIAGSLTKGQMHDFASTSEKDLPEKAPKSKSKKFSFKK